jgi:hypothetical protein
LVSATAYWTDAALEKKEKGKLQTRKGREKAIIELTNGAMM